MNEKLIRLDQFAAPAFSGALIVYAIADFGQRNYGGGILTLALVVGYWSRAIYLWRDELKAATDSDTSR